jgi:diacylglycerol O-acyltransferase / wax synthase
MDTSGERMLHSDAFAWYMEKDPVLRSTVVAVARLDRAPDWEQVRSRVDRLTRLVPKLRMRVQAPPLRIGPPQWTIDDSFDLDFHLRRGPTQRRLPRRAHRRHVPLPPPPRRLPA